MEPESFFASFLGGARKKGKEKRNIIDKVFFAPASQTKVKEEGRATCCDKAYLASLIRTAKKLHSINQSPILSSLLTQTHAHKKLTLFRTFFHEYGLRKYHLRGIL